MAKEETNTETSSESAAIEDTPKVFSRDDIRTAILDAKGESEIISVNGVKVEVRSPMLEDLLKYRDSQGDDSIMARAIANNVYVPETDQLVFDEADIPGLMKAKFTGDMKTLNAAVTRVLGGDEQIQLAVDSQTKSDPE